MLEGSLRVNPALDEQVVFDVLLLCVFAVLLGIFIIFEHVLLVVGCAVEMHRMEFFSGFVLGVVLAFEDDVATGVGVLYWAGVIPSHVLGG